MITPGEPGQAPLHDGLLVSKQLRVSHVYVHSLIIPFGMCQEDLDVPAIGSGLLPFLGSLRESMRPKHQARGSEPYFELEW